MVRCSARHGKRRTASIAVDMATGIARKAIGTVTCHEGLWAEARQARHRAGWSTPFLHVIHLRLKASRSSQGDLRDPPLPDPRIREDEEVR